jgi:hypothetical protein
MRSIAKDHECGHWSGTVMTITGTQRMYDRVGATISAAVTADGGPPPGVHALSPLFVMPTAPTTSLMS